MNNLVCVTVFVIIGQVLAALHDECLMPITNEKGFCISIYNCPHFLSNVFNRTADVEFFMRKSRCGTGPAPHLDPLVCCGRVATLLPEECGISGVGQRIIGGEETSIDAYPWMALLNYKNSSGFEIFLCGGFMINTRYVLTAAHCIEGRVPDYYQVTLTNVRMGEHDIRTNPDEREDEGENEPYVDILIEKYTIHHRYNKVTKQNDIALLRLAEEIEISEFRRPICLPIHKEMAKPKDIMFVAGWGLADLDPKNPNLVYRSPMKRHINLTLFDQKNCSRMYRSLFNKQLCAGGEENRDSCAGDSGGPLMNRRPKSDFFYAEGIVSYGPMPCGLKGVPGVYVRVAAYIDWILDHMTP